MPHPSGRWSTRKIGGIMSGAFAELLATPGKQVGPVIRPFPARKVSLAALPSVFCP